MDQRMPKRRFGLLLTADRGYLKYAIVNVSIFFDSRGVGFAYWFRVLTSVGRHSLTPLFCCTPFLIPTLVLRIGNVCILFVFRQVVFVNIFSAFAILGSFPAERAQYSSFSDLSRKRSPQQILARSNRGRVVESGCEERFDRTRPETTWAPMSCAAHF